MTHRCPGADREQLLPIALGDILAAAVRVADEAAPEHPRLQLRAGAACQSQRGQAEGTEAPPLDLRDGSRRVLSPAGELRERSVD